MLDAGVDGRGTWPEAGSRDVAPGDGGCRPRPDDAAGPSWGCWRMAASPENNSVGAESVSAGGRRCALARWRDRSECMERGARPVAAGVAVDGRRERGSEMAIERPRGRRGASQPRARTALDLATRGWAPSRRAAVPALAGGAGPRTAMAAVARLRVDDCDGQGGAAAAAGSRTARGAVRRDRCG